MNPTQWAIAPRYLIDPLSGRHGWTLMGFSNRGEVIAFCSHSHHSPDDAIHCSEARNTILAMKEASQAQATLAKVNNAIRQEQIKSLENSWQSKADVFPREEM